MDTQFPGGSLELGLTDSTECFGARVEALVAVASGLSTRGYDYVGFDTFGGIFRQGSPEAQGLIVGMG